MVLIGSAVQSLILPSVSSVFLSQSIQVFLISVPPSRRAICPAGLNANWVPSLWAPRSVVRCQEDGLSSAQPPAPGSGGRSGGTGSSRDHSCPLSTLSSASLDVDRLPASPAVAVGPLISAQAHRTVSLRGFISQTRAVPGMTGTHSGGGDRQAHVPLTVPGT